MIVGVLAASVACGSDDPVAVDPLATTAPDTTTPAVDGSTAGPHAPAVTSTTATAETATTATSTTSSGPAATTSTPSSGSTSVRVIVTLDPERSVTETADLLRAHFGEDLLIEAELTAFGQLIVIIDADRRDELTVFDGVAAVQDDLPDAPDD
jgi:hypothetical protein